MSASCALRQAVFSLLVFAATVMSASAQGVGAIAGTVTDASGAVLPGATVTLTSAQGTVGGNREVATDERGAYQFLRLVPGTYSVKASLQGFRPFTQAGITVNSDQTSRADARLEIGTMEEGIVVSGEAPLLDTTSALKQTVIPQEVLEALPNRMDVWAITRVIPSITVSKVDVGGSESFLQSGVTVRGTDNEGGYYIDGMDVSSLDGEGDGATMYLDPYAFAESNFLAGNNPAESPRGGLVFNMVTKTGTNQFHGGGMFSGASKGMGFDNFSDQLEADLLATVPPSVLAANPELKPGADINYIWDTGFWFAGPIKQDKLWFSTTYHYQKLLQYFLGSYNPDGTQTPDDHYLYTTNNKVAWQVNQTSQLSYYFTLQRKVNGHRLGGIVRRFEGVEQQQQVSDGAPGEVDELAVVAASPGCRNQPLLRRRSILAAARCADGRHRALRYADQLRPARAADVQQQPDVSRRPDWQRQLFHDDARHQGRLLDELREADRQRVFDLGTCGPSIAMGFPISSTRTTRRSAPSRRIASRACTFRTGGVPTRKLTLNLGLRYETNYGWMPETCQPQTEFIAARCFDAVDGAPDWKAVNPRFSVVYDLMGDGSTAFKFAANRYVVPVGVQVVGRVNPVSAVSDNRQWLPQSRCAEAATLGCDRNGDLTPQLNELGPSSGYALGTSNRYEPGYDWPNANEYTVELQRQLPGNLVVSGGYTRREKRNQLGVRNVAVPTRHVHSSERRRSEQPAER